MYTDRWTHVGGVWLHFQDWPGPRGAETVLLLHGLTQQSHVFDPVAARLGSAYRCVALDFRGRGESEWAPPATYAVAQYVGDVLGVLGELRLAAVHVIGISLGGLVALSLAAVGRGRLRSLVLDDIGPEIDPRGAARVAASTAAAPGGFPTLEAAIAWARSQYPFLAARPLEEVAETVRWAVRPVPGGTWRLKFDPAIARAPRPPAAVAEATRRAWWWAFARLRCPILLIRGAESDVLSAETAAAMQSRQPGLHRVDVPGVGHAPTLTEPAAVAALARFYGPPGLAGWASS
jgi:pimeloyl-ACP methyl ester carboxylesterase